eukprot:916937_1
MFTLSSFCIICEHFSSFLSFMNTLSLLFLSFVNTLSFLLSFYDLSTLSFLSLVNTLSFYIISEYFVLVFIICKYFILIFYHFVNTLLLNTLYFVNTLSSFFYHL